jgi:hypothetical protein
VVIVFPMVNPSATLTIWVLRVIVALKELL